MRYNIRQLQTLLPLYPFLLPSHRFINIIPLLTNTNRVRLSIKMQHLIPSTFTKCNFTLFLRGISRRCLVWEWFMLYFHRTKSDEFILCRRIGVEVGGGLELDLLFLLTGCMMGTNSPTSNIPFSFENLYF